MTARLTSAMLVGSLVRRVQSAGGFAMVLKKGDPLSGAILIQAADRGVIRGLFERQPDFSGAYTLVPTGPKQESLDADLPQYLERRRRSDPDLWILELDIADAERFAAETLC